MRFTNSFLTFITLFIFCASFAQINSKNTQEQTLKELIKIKKELTNDDELKEFYKIQLYSGNLKNAEEVKKDFDYQFNFSSTIKYESPNYKVWIGNFRTRLEADRAMLKIDDSFQTAFIIKPGR